MIFNKIVYNYFPN